MPRPRKCRLVTKKPKVTYFKPLGVPMMDLAEVYLTVEGLEALRLADIEGLKHEEAAERMNVSRQTFGRVLAEARGVTARAVVQGMALCVQGGHYMVQKRGRDAACGRSKAGLGPKDRAGGDRPFSRDSQKEQSMTKIAISSEGPTLDDLVDPRFGRAGGFIILDPDSMEFEYLDNGGSQTMSQGVGIQTAEMVARSGAKAILTGYVGPKAFEALKAVNLEVIQDLEGITVREAVNRYKNGQVNKADQPNNPGV